MIKKNKRIPVIELKNVVKFYSLHDKKPTFFEKILKNKKDKIHVAIDDVSLRVFKGQRVGILGSNGSGKTTLLKLIAGITTPNYGSISIEGVVTSLISLDAGFHPELTGKENIFLNGLVVGMNQKEIKEKFEKIIKFANIGEFINEPLYTYSEGMKMRLGFSIAIHANPDILLVDEGALAAGDIAFEEKINKKIKTFLRAKKTIVLVSHRLDYLQKHCDYFVWVEKSKIKAQGDAKIIKAYLNS